MPNRGTRKKKIRSINLIKDIADKPNNYKLRRILMIDPNSEKKEIMVVSEDGGSAYNHLKNTYFKMYGEYPDESVLREVMIEIMTKARAKGI